jgi:hypothetical protein
MDIVKLLREVPWVGPRYDGRRRSDLKPTYFNHVSKCLDRHLRIFDVKVNVGGHLRWLDGG